MALEKQYRTKMVTNGTNSSFTVPLPLAEDGKLKKKSAWVWDKPESGDRLTLNRLPVNMNAARKRARRKHDVVFLQEMSRPGKNSQWKINLPKWIIGVTRLDTVEKVYINWELDEKKQVSGFIPLTVDVYEESALKEGNVNLDECDEG